MLDLKPKYLTIIRKLLSQYVLNMTVWAYGSRVNGQSHEGSDLDLVILDPHDFSRPQKNLEDLRAAFSESGLPILVDILDRARISVSFQEEIKKSHVVIPTKPLKK
jgi:predicted nucleotidyltransferase